MIVKISRQQVKIGMFIHALEGSWLDHSFWRRKFLLSQARDLKRIQQSNIHAVLIDDEKGLGLDVATNETAIALPIERIGIPAPPLARAKPRLRNVKPCSAERETARAQKIVNRSKRIVLKMFDDIRFGRTVEVAPLTKLVDDIHDSVARNALALINIVRLKNKDEYTYMHSVAVSALMIGLARALAMDEAKMADIGMAGLLHDIGKLTVSDEILNKPGKLTDIEREKIRLHPEGGRMLLAKVADVPDIAIDVCLHHHEKIDGTGYPFALTGDALSIYARMAAICDVYDAVTSNRPYKQAWSPQQAIDNMAAWQGHFDSDIFEAFTRSVAIFPANHPARLAPSPVTMLAPGKPGIQRVKW